MSRLEFETYYNNAKNALKDRKYLQFIKNVALAEHYTKDSPEDRIEILYLYATGLIDFWNYKESLKVVEKLIPLTNGVLKTKLMNAKGALLGKVGHLEQGIQIFEDIFANEESPYLKIKALNNLAWAYIYQYKATKNEEYLIQAVEKCKKVTCEFDTIEPVILKKRVLNNLGTAYWFLGEFAEAKNVFKEALVDAPDDPKILHNIASACHKLNQLDECEEYLTRAERLAAETDNIPQKADSYRLRAEIAESKQKYVKALDFYIKAHEAFVNANFIVEANECSEKMAYLISLEDGFISRVKPSTKQKVLFEIAWANIHQYKISKNEEYLHLSITKCKEIQNKFELVDNDLKKAILNNLGTAYWFLEEYEKALNEFTQALVYAPEDPQIYNNIAATYHRLNQLEEADKYLNKAELLADKAEKVSQKAETYRLRAEIAETREDLVKALDFYITAHDTFVKANYMFEANECSDKMNKLVLLIQSENINIIRKSLKSNQEEKDFLREHSLND